MSIRLLSLTTCSLIDTLPMPLLLFSMPDPVIHKCLLVSCCATRTIPLMESTPLSRIVPSFPNTPEALVFPFMMFGPVSPTFGEPTELPTVLFPCCVSLTTLPVTSTKEEASVRVPLPFTSNHGTPISLPFWICARTTEVNRTVPVICSTLYGFPIYSCNASRKMELGLSFAPTRPEVSPMSTDKNSRIYTKSTNGKARPARPFQHNNCGLPFWTLKWRRELLTCCTRIMPTPSPINKIWVPFDPPTCVAKSWSTLRQMKLPFATWPVSPFPCWSANQRIWRIIQMLNASLTLKS
mmetsp:Transcript_21989/g.54334  ORF Transcript_21989/g.54334 Transcript_21989/m.54334 type:complete len:295 (+) Transcript_21989:609-1493(+)